MLTNLCYDGVAEDYYADASEKDLKHLIYKGIDSKELRDWLESEYPEEQFDDEDIYEFNRSIISHAELLLNDMKQIAAQELRESVEGTIEDSCDCLEDYEIAGILSSYVTQYLNINL